MYTSPRPAIPARVLFLPLEREALCYVVTNTSNRRRAATCEQAPRRRAARSAAKLVLGTLNVQNISARRQIGSFAAIADCKKNGRPRVTVSHFS